MVGIGIGLQIEPALSARVLLWLAAAVGMSAVLSVLVRDVQWAAIACVIIVGGGLGVLRVGLAPEVEPPTYEQWTEFSGTIIREPELRVDAQRFVVESADINGLVQVSVPLHPRVSYGDQLDIGCMLKEPEPFDGFRYDRYLERYQIRALCYYPSWTVTGHQPSFMRALFMWKRARASQVQHALAPPEHTIVLGALFGYKRAIPKQIADQFRATGTSHLLVISGLHVSLLTSIIIAALSRLPLPRNVLIAAVISLLAVYVVLTGGQPSAMRAATFGSALLVAEVLGRRSSSLRILVIAAAVMLAANPLLLFYDAGFQLSFLATAGIIIFSPWFQERLFFTPQLLGLRAAAATSCAAIFATAPLIAYSFHSFSLAAFLANMIVVPMMPLIMIGALALTIVSAISSQLAAWCAIPLYYLIHALVDIVAWFAAWSYASLTILHAGIGFGGRSVRRRRQHPSAWPHADSGRRLSNPDPACPGRYCDQRLP